MITQPEGPSFRVDGDAVEWERWRFRLGFNQVEGLTLHQIGFGDGDQGRVRSLVYRASIAGTDGRPRTLPNAICMHEEDATILWKHTDEYSHSSDVRRNRRLVVSLWILRSQPRARRTGPDAEHGGASCSASHSHHHGGH